jgi:glucokinase
MTDGVVLAADVGGTQMRAALVDGQGKVLARRMTETPRGSDVPVALIELIREVARDRTFGDVTHAVVGLPGAVDYKAGHLLWAPNLPEQWPKRLTRDELTFELGMPTSIANDADLAAVGEARYGAGAGSTEVAYLTISTGIGAGIVQSGRLVHGIRSLAEVGHTVIDLHAWREGRPSTLEELASGSGLSRLGREAGLGEVTGRDVLAAARQGDPRAAAIRDDAIAACAIGVTNLVMSFYSSTVVVGGGLGLRDEFFAPLCELCLRRYEYPGEPRIVRAALGDDAGLAGAAGWVQALAD